MNSQLQEYLDFLSAKAQLRTGAGLSPDRSKFHPSLKPHQVDAVEWALQRGKGLLAASFGMGKTRMQIELLRQVHEHTGKPVLVIAPLGVRHQFIYEDGPAMALQFQYVRNDDEALAADTPGARVATGATRGSEGGAGGKAT